jgi:tetratricopeptide (TPR) repeat protein
VVGKVFWAGALGDRDRTWLDERLHRLERKQFVVRERRSTVAGEDEFVFRHVLVREVAYGQIPRADRAAKHRRVAEWIDALGRRKDDAEMLAHHYSTALDLARAAGDVDPGLEARARSALREAGDRALGLHAYLAAAQFYGRALKLWPRDDPKRALILSQYGRALVYGEARGVDELAEALEALLAAGETETAAETAAWLGTMYQEEGKGEEARRELRRARELVEPLPPSLAKGEVLGNVSRSLMMAGDHAEAISVGEQALTMARTLGNEELEAHALINIGSARIGVDPRKGRTEIDDGIAVAVSIGSVEAARGYGNLASLLVNQGDLRGAWKAQEQASELAQRFGAWWFTRWLRAERIPRFFFEGRWDELCEAAEETIPEPMFDAIPARSIRAQVRLARDDVAGAVADAREAVQLALRAEDLQIVLPTLADAAFVLRGAGEREEAAAYVEGVLRRWRERDTLSNWLWAPKLAATLLELGRADEFVQPAPPASSNTWMQAALALAREDCEAAAERYAEIGSLPDEAYARLRAAERLVGEGNGAEADVQLQLALAFWRSVGATRYVREGETLLAALGA